MGCTASRARSQVDNAPEQHPNDGLFDSNPSIEEKPQPLVFAIIRNGHEVVRGGLRDVESYLQQSELELATSEWRQLVRWWHTHQRLELGAEGGKRPIGFLRLLDNHCDGISTKNKFFEDYKEVQQHEEELNAAFETNDLFQIKGFFYDYKDSLLALLKREDELLMPQIDEMAERRLPLKKFMRRDVMGNLVDSFGFESFIRHAFVTLEKHHGGMPRVRVYGHALHTVATRKQWQQWLPWIEQSVSAESFQELQEVIRVEK